MATSSPTLFRKSFFLPLIPGFENCRIFILQKSSSEENCQIWCNEWLVSGPMGAHGRQGGGRVEATCGLANCLPDTTLVVPWNPTLGSTTMASTPSFAILLTILVVLAAISVFSIFLIIDISRCSSINSFDRPLSPPSKTILLVVYIHVEKIQSI